MMGKYIERDNYSKAFVVPRKNFCFGHFTNLITRKATKFGAYVIVAAESVKRFGPRFNHWSTAQDYSISKKA